MAYINVGPAFLCITRGDPTSGANWSVYNLSDFTFDMGNQFAQKTNAFSAVADHEGLVTLPSVPVMNCSLKDSDLDTIVDIVQGSAKLTQTTDEAVEFPHKIVFHAKTTIMRVAIIPLAEATGTNDEDAPHGIWLPAAFATTGPSNLRYSRVESGSDPTQPYDFTIQGLLDKDLTNGRAGWIGDPAAVAAAGAPSTWVLPSLPTEAV